MFGQVGIHPLDDHHLGCGGKSKESESDSEDDPLNCVSVSLRASQEEAATDTAPTDASMTLQITDEKMNDLQSSLSALVPWVSRQRGQRLKRKLECLYESGFKLEAFQVPSDDSESDSDAPDHRYYSHNFDFASFVDSQLVLTQLTVGWLQCVAFSAQVAFSQRLKTPEAETSTKGERIAATGCQWVAIVLDVLREHLLNKRHPSSYGSDCSGLDAPWWALRELFMGMKAWPGSSIVHDEFWLAEF